MSIPQYHIVRIAVERQMNEQFQHGPEQEPERPDRSRDSILIAVRLRLSVMLHSLAQSIEPARPDPGCANGQHA